MMEQALQELDYSETEAQLYLHLLGSDAQTAAMIAQRLKQTRTNTYMLLNKLVGKGIVLVDEAAAVKKFAAANPRVLQRQLREQQQSLARTGKSLEMAMPELLAAFNLARQRPGVIYLEGYDGLKSSFEDQAKAKTDLLVWGSDIADRDPKVWRLMENGGYKRRALGIRTRALFHAGAASWPHLGEFAGKGFEIRLWGAPITGEVLIYDNRVTFTTYELEIVVTVLTNDVIADTFRAIFEQCWADAAEI